MRTNRWGLLAALLLPITQGLYAAGLPAYYPATFPATGKVDAIYYTEHRIVIGDRGFALAADVKVRTPYAESDTLYGVRAGQYIGYRQVLGDGGRTVVEIWVLDHPPRYTE